MLGICSALAVTAQMKTTLTMCIAVIVVMTLSNTIISLMRNVIPNKIRMIVEMIRDCLAGDLRKRSAQSLCV